MLQAIEGIYKDGMIKLLETPQGVAESRVIVTFLGTESAIPTTQMMVFGMFTSPNLSTEDDFQNATFL
jgi:hypothetical protein